MVADPDRVDIHDMAHLEGSNRVASDSSGVTWKDRFAVKLHYYNRLYWHHKAALLLAQGATVQDVLGPKWIVVDGKGKPDWHPRPGLEPVLMAEVVSNQGGLPTEYIFYEIRKALGL